VVTRQYTCRLLPRPDPERQSLRRQVECSWLAEGLLDLSRSVMEMGARGKEDTRYICQKRKMQERRAEFWQTHPTASFYEAGIGIQFELEFAEFGHHRVSSLDDSDQDR
jgi:hypothetical protein